MKKVIQLIETLKALGYAPKHNEEKKEVYFTSFGFDSFPENHKTIVRVILGKNLREFYYGGINTQHIYYR